jgi:hypothetical protein
MEKESDLDDILNYRSAAEFEMQVRLLQVMNEYLVFGYLRFYHVFW